jgi:hypothetical protein
MTRRSSSWGAALALSVLLCLGPTGCRGDSPATDSSLSPNTTAATTASTGSADSSPLSTVAARASGEATLSKAVSWLEAAPTRVDFGPYSVTYGGAGQVAELTTSPTATGEPMTAGTWWWSGDSDYYIDEGDGAVRHVTPEMAMRMRQTAYPQAESGVQCIALVRLLLDPHRLLKLSTVTDASALPDGGWTLVAEARVPDLVGLDLSADDLARYFGMVSAVQSTLVVAGDGAIRSMSTQEVGLEVGVVGYSFTRVDTEPALPSLWSDLDQVTLQAALDEGWRAAVADAAKDVDFTIYSLGDSYEDWVIQTVHVEVGLDVMLHYGTPRETGSGGTTAGAGRPRAEDGFILFEYSASNVPESEKPFVADKTLVAKSGEGDAAYSVYTTAKGLPGRAILVKKGGTYISITRTGKGGADVTELLLAVATALRSVD